MNRRDFLKLLGLGAAALAIEEPVRKMWFVPSNAPVGSRVELPGWEAVHPAWMPVGSRVERASRHLADYAPFYHTPELHRLADEGMAKLRADALDIREQKP